MSTNHAILLAINLAVMVYSSFGLLRTNDKFWSIPIFLSSVGVGLILGEFLKFGN